MIVIWAPGSLNSIQGISTLDRDLESIKSSVPWVFNYNDACIIEDIERTSISIDGVPADYLTMYIPHQPEDDYFSGTLRAVYFESQGFSWVVTMTRDNEKNQQTDHDFDHLLSTLNFIKQ
jgi:hypothetical protein